MTLATLVHPAQPAPLVQKRAALVVTLVIQATPVERAALAAPAKPVLRVLLAIQATPVALAAQAAPVKQVPPVILVTPETRVPLERAQLVILAQLVQPETLVTLEPQVEPAPLEHEAALD